LIGQKSVRIGELMAKIDEIEAGSEAIHDYMTQIPS